ncbi:MAG TPA: hypothetical protein VMA73_34045 [Streptosporangiaceae bacterium]|nr:hypothetical protein [Streptosporangiaceae bacterium]
MAAFVPTGWPEGVHPPGTPGFEQTAVNWLLDVVPPDYRLHGVLVRHPVALATLAKHHLAACVEGARQGYRSARAELGEDLPPGGLAAVLSAYQTEGQRLVATARAVDLIGRALRGDTFVPQLAGSPASRHPAAGDQARSDRTARGADSPGRTAGSPAGTGNRSTGANGRTPRATGSPAGAADRSARATDAPAGTGNRSTGANGRSPRATDRAASAARRSASATGPAAVR